MAPHSSTLAWKIPWAEEPGRLQSMGLQRVWTRLNDFTFTFHFHALEKEMATHSSVLAWRIPATEEPGGLPSMGLHRARHDWSDLAAAVIYVNGTLSIHPVFSFAWDNTFIKSPAQCRTHNRHSVNVSFSLTDFFHWLCRKALWTDTRSQSLPNGFGK